jgi:2-oxoisovalerate dehydrogenase E1 component
MRARTSIRSADLPISERTPNRDPVDLLKQMLHIRKVEERVLALRHEGKVSGSVHLCVGQESVPVGVVSVLDDRDRVLATYRGHGWALACGVPTETLLAEILGRSTGTNGGRGGSAYLTSPDHGFIGENSIVGAGLPIANGVAMAQLFRGDGGVTVVSFGDGATNQGATHEALVFAIARTLPVIFVCENNSWSEMTPILDTVPGAELADRAAAYGMPAHVIDGRDMDAIQTAAASAIERARMGLGPSFLEISVPRILGHYNADIEHYRSAEDRAEHASRDPIGALKSRLLKDGTLSESELHELESAVVAAVLGSEGIALSSPLPDPATARDHVVGAGIWGLVGALPQEASELAYGIAANRALGLELEQRPEVVVFGEDIAIPGGTFGVTRNLRKRFGDRVFDTPISESAILGAAVGASIQGLRPIVEIMWADFLFVAFDQIVNQASNVRYLSRGQVTAPLVIRTQQGMTPGSCAQHSQSMEALIAHVPGIKVGLPSTPHDAFAMLRAAVADPDPVVIIESRELYLTTGPVDMEAPTETVGGARIRRTGSDLLIVTWGRITNLCLQAAEELESLGISATVLDLRWLAPLDEEAIFREMATAGKVLIVHEANLTGGFGAEIAARIVERHFDKLKAPILRLGAPDVRMPAAPALQNELVPTVRDIVRAASGLARR